MTTTTAHRRFRTTRLADHAHPYTLPDLAVDALASFRLTKLIRDDFITEPLRRVLRENAGEPDESKVAYLMQCPWCMSVYFGFALALARLRWPRATSVASHALAVSALTGLLATRADDS